MSRKAWILAGVGLIVVAAAIILAWPAPDPFRGAETVALRVGNEPQDPSVDYVGELSVVLGDRDLRVVSDEREADVVLSITNVRADLGNVQLALSGGKLTGRASAVCRAVNVRTGKAYVSDLVITLRDGVVRANLVGRRFWEFWKPRVTM